MGRPGRAGAPAADPRRRRRRAAPRCWPSPPCPPCSSSWSGNPCRAGSGTPGGRSRVTRCACSAWRRGWPGPPAARSSCAPSSPTCAAATSAAHRARRSWTGWRRGSPSACSPLTSVGAPLACRPAPAPARCRPSGHGRPVGSCRADARRRAESRPWPAATTMRCSRATRCGASRDEHSATAPTGRRSPRSTSAATWPTARASSTPIRSGRDGACVFPAPRPSRPASSGHRPRHRAGRRPGRPGDHLPELVALGLGSLACAALARRARRRRTPVDPFTGDLDPAAEPVGGRRRRGGAPAALRRGPRAPLLRGRQLPARAGTLQDDPRRPEGPGDLRVGLRRHVLVGRAAGDDAPGGFVPRDGRHRLARRTTTRSDDHDAFPPYVPLVLPVGDDDEAPGWSPSGPATCCRSSARRRPRSVRAARAAAGAWAWSDTVARHRRPDDPALRCPSAAPTRWLARHLPLLRRPGALSAGGGRGTRAVVTTAHGRRQRPDGPRRPPRRHAPPMGRVVRPHLQSAETAGSADGARSAPPSRAAAEPTPPPTTRTGVRTAAAPVRRHGGALAPGTVDVRLLTMTPRLDGLREDLPAQPGPAGGRARGLPGPAPARRDHQRPPAHAGAGLVRRRRRVQDPLQHRLRGAARHGRRRARRSPLPRRDAARASTSVSPQVTVDVHRAVALAAEGQGAGRPRAGHRLLPRRARTGRGRAAGQRAVGVLVVGGRGSRRAHRRRARRRRLRHGRAGGRRRALRARPVGPRAGPPRRALQRGALPSRHGAGGRRGRRRPAPPRVARRASAGSTPSTRAARRRRAPSRSTASSAAGSSSARRTAEARSAAAYAPAAERLHARPPTPYARTTSSRRATRLPLTSSGVARPQRAQQRDGVVDVVDLGRRRRGRSGSRRPRSRAPRPARPRAGARPRSRRPARP